MMASTIGLPPEKVASSLVDRMAEYLLNRPTPELLAVVVLIAVLGLLMLVYSKLNRPGASPTLKNVFEFFGIGKKHGSPKGEEQRPASTQPMAGNITINVGNKINDGERGVTEESVLLADMTHEVVAKEEVDAVSASASVDREYEVSDYSSTDMVLVISKSVRFGAEVAKFKDLELIKSQMGAAEMRTDLIEGMLIKEYMELIFKKKGYVNINDDQSFLIYDKVIHDYSHRNILSLLRKIFKDNHLTSYDDEGYEDYVSKQCERLMFSIGVSVNNSIPSFLDPGREAVNDLLAKKTSFIVGIFRDIFYEARALVVKSDLIIRRKEREFDEEIKKLTGIHNAHRRVVSHDPYTAETIEDRRN
jgi:hypothetical protein